ncbi:hypothetical protein NAL32_22045 [Chryseobacterium sp. Ch-15]|uniref:Uncharacterized protein n=1 Tax=Chryseobacterium muglaense TaxID=2893752 RepID=A0A9Q3YSS7_9FLAO|nr:hypothetical protein [Chryseobacterium muglaense]MBD3907359.1 hypothetical protein [Chryseobacterium muglaense]MCC9035708.1 hypothetical protein [Chryseobacterium muglaense]MCM2557070.1 hypothetical protein [Chryseobacterium muglaense]
MHRNSLLGKNNASEYIEFNIRSQDLFFETQDERWILYPIIENSSVAGIVAAILRKDETEVEFRQLDPDGENYRNIILPFSAAYMKARLETTKNAKGSGCGFEWLPECGIQEVIITVPSPPKGPQPPTTPFNPPSGCSRFQNCLNPDPGGGGGGLPQLQLNPCAKIAKIGRSGDTKEFFKNLKGKTTGTDIEHGFLLNENDSGIGGVPVQGQPGGAGIDFNVTSPVDGFIHSHYTGLLSIFSPEDILTIANLYNNGMIKDMNSFIMGVVTASGTQYIIVIDDPVKFGAFASNVMAGGQLDQAMIEAYSVLYNNIFQIKPQNPVNTNENNFVKYLESNNTGLKVLKGDETFSNWALLSKNSNGNIVPQNCP